MIRQITKLLDMHMNTVSKFPETNDLRWILTMSTLEANVWNQIVDTEYDNFK